MAKDDNNSQEYLSRPIFQKNNFCTGKQIVYN